MFFLYCFQPIFIQRQNRPQQFKYVCGDCKIKLFYNICTHCKKNTHIHSLNKFNIIFKKYIIKCNRCN